MKRFAPVFLLVLLVIGGLLSFYPAAEAVAITDEDFDSVTPPTLPTGWTDASGGTATFETSADESQSSPNSVRTEVNTVGTPQGIGRFDMGVQDDIDVSFQWRVDSDDSGDSCVVEPECHIHGIALSQSAGGGNDIAGMGILAGGDLIRYRDWLPSASTPSTGITIVYGRWYTFRFDVDFGPNTYDAYIDGVLVADDADMRTGRTSVSVFDMSSQQTEEVVNGGQIPASMWVDNLTISNSVALAVTTTAVTSGALDDAYSYDADDNSILAESWSITTGPSFLSIAGSTGIVSGTLTEGGYFNVIISVTAGVDGTATQDYNLTVNGQIAITSTAVLTATINSLYSYSADSNYSSNETWTCTTCPSYLTIDSGTGVLSGTPTATGTDSVVISVDTDIAGDLGPATQSYSITVSGGGGWGIHPGRQDPGIDPATNIFWGDYRWWFELPENEKDELIPPEPFICDVNTNVLTFQDTSVKPEVILLVLWDFGDGTQPTTTISNYVVHEYPGVGIYTMEYSVVLQAGPIIRQKLDVTIGECAPPLITEPIPAMLTMTLVTAGTFWIVFAFTRNPLLGKWNLVLTAVGIVGFAVYFLFF